MKRWMAILPLAIFVGLVVVGFQRLTGGRSPRRRVLRFSPYAPRRSSMSSAWMAARSGSRISRAAPYS